MKKRIFCLLISLLFITSIIPIATSINILKNDEKVTSHGCGSLNGGWLEERDGINILHLTGLSYNMGYQHGFFLREEIHANFNAFCNWIVDRGF